MALTIEQQRALAISAARQRAASQQQGVHQEQTPQRGFWEAVGGLAKATGTGVAEGGFELMTAPETAGRGIIQPIVENFWNFVTGRDASNWHSPEPDAVAQTQDAMRTEMGNTLYQPQTGPEEYFRTIGQMLPGAVLAPGGVTGNLLRYGVLPGILSETAGQLTEGTAAEPYVRFAGALVGTGLGALTHSPTAAAAGLEAGAGATQVLARALRNSGLTEAQMARATELMNNGNVPLTWSEAISQATDGAVDLGLIQRAVERVGAGSQPLSQMMAGRPGAMTAAMQEQASRLGPSSAVVPPESLAATTQNLADGAMESLRAQINDITRPNYARAAPTTIPPDEFGRLMNDPYTGPVFRQALDAVMGNPALQRYVSGQPVDSIAVLDQVKKYLDELGALPAPDRTRTISASYGAAARDVRDTAAASSTDYRMALRQQEDMRTNVLQPAERGPMGLIARTEDLKGQQAAMFPRSPPPGSDAAVGNAVRQLAAESPEMASAFVRSHVEQVFNDATRTLQSGPNQFGGAGFAKALTGNTEQARNLQAYITGLPDGAARWEGFSQMLDVFEATGRRLPRGSDTAFNERVLGALDGGGPIGTAVSTAASPGKALSIVSDFYERFRFGRNSAELAAILTDPASGPALAALARGGAVKDLLPIVAMLVGQSPNSFAREGYTPNQFPAPNLGSLVPAPL
jgi:hypothetical protein